MKLIDIGVNLTDRAFASNIDAVLERARSESVTHAIVTGTSYEESCQAVTLCEQFPNQLFATCGCHPHNAKNFSKTEEEKFLQLLSHNKVKAVGECGLDFNRNFSPPDVQIKVFEKQIEWAIETGLPLFLHQRDAHEKLLQILTKHRSNLTKIVIHCFTDGKLELKDYLNLDCYIGITGWVTDDRRNHQLKEALANIPLNRLMIETDAPYLMPKNIIPKPKTRKNEPATLKFVLEKIARLLNIEKEYLANQIWENTHSFFQLKH